jgi:hypothetical protein
LIVPLQNYAALMAGTTTQATFGAPIELELGGRGIRSIDKGTDGNYLIVAGPAGAAVADVDRNFALFAWNGNPNSAPVELSNNLDASCARKREAASNPRSRFSGPVTAGTQVQLLTRQRRHEVGRQDGVERPARRRPEIRRLRRAPREAVGRHRRAEAADRQCRRPAAWASTSIRRSCCRSTKPMRLGSGSIVLHKADGSVVETFNTNSPGSASCKWPSTY